MPKYDSVIFDLDGTLWDSRECVAEARNIVMERLGYDLRFTGEDVQKTMGMTSDKVYEISFASIPKEEYPEIRRLLGPQIAAGVLAGRAKLFPEVEPTLEKLKEKMPLFLVSNCSVPYFEAYFKWSGHSRYFKDSICYGTNSLPKADNIRLIVARNGLKDPVYVGDTKGDQQSAAAAGVDYIHCDYGFGEAEGLCARIARFRDLLERV